MQIYDLGSFKLHAGVKFRETLHAVTKSKLKSSPIPTWAANRVIEAWNVYEPFANAYIFHYRQGAEVLSVRSVLFEIWKLFQCPQPLANPGAIVRSLFHENPGLRGFDSRPIFVGMGNKIFGSCKFIFQPVLDIAKPM